MNKLIELNYKNIALLSLLLIINAVISNNILSIILPVFQVLIVLYYANTNKIQIAVLLHFIFMVTSFSGGGSDADGSENMLKTGYFALKLFGPITLSYLVAIFLLIKTFKYKTKTPLSKNTLFLKSRKLFEYYLISGVILGCIGLLFFDYYIEQFIGYIVYIGMLLVHLIMLINIHSHEFIKTCFDVIISLFVASWISTIFNYFTGFTYEYSIYDKVKICVVADFSIIMLLFYPVIKQKLVLLILFFAYLGVVMLGGVSGKFFLNASIIAFIFLLSQMKKGGKSSIMYIFIFCVFLIIIAGISINQEDSMFSYKLDQFLSLGSLFSGSIDGVGSSPYIRVASFINIAKENIQNPIFFIFGRGFGGYFEDSLHLFASVDISNGGFNQKYIDIGKFPTAHSTFNLVPLLHGFGGFFLLMKLVVEYFKKSVRGCYFCAVALLWLLLMFYYGVLIAVAAIFILYVSEYEFNKECQEN